MNIPSCVDWGEIGAGGLERKPGQESFRGKTFAEAETMFRSNALYYQEELQFLPKVPFNYYAPALVSYLLSDAPRGDSDGASSFLHMLIWMLQSNRDVIADPTKGVFVEAASRIARRQQYYEAPEHIYGNFTDLFAQISQLAEHDA